MFAGTEEQLAFAEHGPASVCWFCGSGKDGSRRSRRQRGAFGETRDSAAVLRWGVVGTGFKPRQCVWRPVSLPRLQRACPGIPGRLMLGKGLAGFSVVRARDRACGLRKDAASTPSTLPPEPSWCSAPSSGATHCCQFILILADVSLQGFPASVFAIRLSATSVLS